MYVLLRVGRAGRRVASSHWRGPYAYTTRSKQPIRVAWLMYAYPALREQVSQQSPQRLLLGSARILRFVLRPAGLRGLAWHPVPVW
jgi:hypothetical protein